MSRITKYLKQKCTYEKLVRDSKGNAVLDKYGEPSYEAPITIKCRRETLIHDVLTNTGSILKSSTRYFTDVEPDIQANDKLDGKPVLKVQEYINQYGVAEGFESYA